MSKFSPAVDKRDFTEELPGETTDIIERDVYRALFKLTLRKKILIADSLGT